MTIYYGARDNDRHPIAAHIWGHRLRAGQHWIEYMLEFLSVLSGFEYRLGQGLPDRDGQEGYQTEYSIPKRLGLRRFIFYDEREKTRDTRDTRAVTELRTHLRQIMPGLNGQPNEDLLDQVRSLLRSFSAIEEERSWYAKALFPVHQEFLLWEALRKGSTLKAYSLPVNDLDLVQLDQGVEFRARNFFARGGELYYLMISAGTEHDPTQRERIGWRLKALLTDNNTALGRIAQMIDTTWRDLSGDDDQITGKLGWILDPECPLYRQFAEDLDTFLDNDLDSLECLELLAHLIGFHIVSYIYHRANPASHPEGHASGSCLECCRPILLVDLLGDQNGGIIRDRSASALRQQDDWQLRQARDLVEQKVRAWAAQEPDDQQLLQHLEDETAQYFSIGATVAKKNYERALREVRAHYSTADTDREALIQEYSAAIFETLSPEFRKNFLGVHRKIGRAIGLVAPRRGPQVRFALGDTLLKTLVMALLTRDAAPIPFGTLLERLFDRYGIVVGAGEARAAGLVERLRINEEYYTRNRDGLLVRMQRAGLLTQYSDATALVRRR
jgi:hypothetical protein